MWIDIEKIADEILAEPLDPSEVTKMAADLSPRARQLRSIMTAAMILDGTKCELKPLDDFPPYQREDENPNILVKGRWLERGGSAWWISTAGTGKSIASMQFAMCMTVGLPFAGFYPNTKPGQGLKFWIIQSEDSPSRITIDREDITAELMEQYPSVDWKEARKSVKFLTIGGKVGAEFLQQLAAVLDIAKERGELPDAVILNPFLAFIGGPITDGAYVTPFLRGGVINRIQTNGLQHLLETYNIGALIYHHTPKPPSENEIEKWMKATFPEYQGAGSSDITNWGRSFVTMMRVKGEPGMVCLTAGKNGGELGWDTIDGASRHYMAWSRGKGITGKSRHAWRDLTDDEFARVTNDSKANADRDIQAIVDSLKEEPMAAVQLQDKMTKQGMKQRAYKAAWKAVSSDYKSYGLGCAEARIGRQKYWVFGLPEAAKYAAFEMETGAYHG